MLVLASSVICLHAGLFIFARDNSGSSAGADGPSVAVSVPVAASVPVACTDNSDTDTSTIDKINFQQIMVDGCIYYAYLDGSLAEVFDLQHRKLCEYRIGGNGTCIISSCISDLDRDGTDEILLITGEEGSEYGTGLLILTLQAGSDSWKTGADPSSVPEEDAMSVKPIFKYDMSRLNPWKIQTCDVDGDGKTEISAGVYKTARFHPVMAKRPFIYEWHGNGISPKWLGSRLSRPFDDYIFADINADGIDELISTEHLRDGKKAVNSYAWKGFGFEGIGESDGFDDILSIEKAASGDGGPDVIAAEVEAEGRRRSIVLRHTGDMLEYSFTDTAGRDRESLTDD